VNCILLREVSRYAQNPNARELQARGLLRAARAMTSVAGFQSRVPDSMGLPPHPIDPSLGISRMLPDRYRLCA
jgi:hypothetical protein